MCASARPSGERVCVVGGGPAGVVTAKTFLDHDFDVTVYEKFDELGGTWSTRRRYVDLEHQIFDLFEFADMPVADTPLTAPEVQAYITEYADRFGVTDHVQFETEVVDVERRADGWRVTTDGADDATRFDYVVVCTGLFHTPHVPSVPGRDAFQGAVSHSTAVSDPDQLADARVVVVGGGKSAADLSTRAAEYGATATQVIREPKWFVPHPETEGSPWLFYASFSRLAEALYYPYYNDDCIRLIDRIPWSITERLWDRIEAGVLRDMGLDDQLLPDIEADSRFARGGARDTAVLPRGYTTAIQRGELAVERAGVEAFTVDGLRLDSGVHLEADVVVFATGFDTSVPFVEDEVTVRDDDGRYRLYRGIVPPGTDGLGFVGFRHTVQNFLSMELAAQWLTAYFRDELVSTPTRAEMEATLDRRLDWEAEVLPDSEGYELGPYQLHYVDELMLDMGLPTKRASNVLSEYLRPAAKPRRYANLSAERKRAVEGAAATSPHAATEPYLGSHHILGALLVLAGLVVGRD